MALSVLEEIIKGDLCANVRKQSQILSASLDKCRAIKRIKGTGLMLGLELDSEEIEKFSDYDQSSFPSFFIVRKLLQAGLLTVAAGPKVVRLLPALNISDQESEQALKIIKQVLEQGS